MNQSIRTSRQRYFSVHQDETSASNSLFGGRRVYGKGEKDQGKSLWGKIKGPLIAIAVFAFLVVAAVVIRLVAFHPGFV